MTTPTDDPHATGGDPPAEEEEGDVLEEAAHDEAMVDGRTAQEEDAAEMDEAERVVAEALRLPLPVRRLLPPRRRRSARVAGRTLCQAGLPPLPGKGGMHGAKRRRKVQHGRAHHRPPPCLRHALTPPFLSTRAAGPVACTVSAVTKPAIRRLARRGGVCRISG